LDAIRNGEKRGEKMRFCIRRSIFEEDTKRVVPYYADPGYCRDICGIKTCSSEYDQKKFEKRVGRTINRIRELK